MSTSAHGPIVTHHHTPWWLPLLLLWGLDPAYTLSTDWVSDPVEETVQASPAAFVGPPLPATSHHPAQRPATPDTLTGPHDILPSSPLPSSPLPSSPHTVPPIDTPPIPPSAPVLAHVGQAPSPDPILSGLGTVGAVVAMNGLLDAQQPLRAGNVGSYYLDLEWHRPLTPQWSWHSMLGLYPLSTGMTTDWRWLYLLHHMPEISLTTHIGRHFIPFGWLSQQCNETSPFALAPLLSQYTWGGNIVGDGILGQWQIAGPWHLQVGGWVHEPKPGTTGFGPAHQLGLIRTVWDIKTKDGMGVSASLHHMKGSGPLHQTQQDHVEWVGADVKWDIPLGAQHTGTLLAEWVGIERQWGSQRFQRSGGYAAGWVANEWMDWGARIDWLEHPEAVLTTSHRMGLMLNIRHAPGTALQLFYSHDPGPQAAHQFGASYLMVIGSHHHTFR